jgi:hypothetical protein
MFVVPLAFVAFALGAFILISLLGSPGAQSSQINLRPIDIRIPLIMVALCAYLVGMVFVGFDLSTFLFLSYSLWLMGERRLWLICFYSLALAVFCDYFSRLVFNRCVGRILSNWTPDVCRAPGVCCLCPRCIHINFLVRQPGGPILSNKPPANRYSNSTHHGCVVRVSRWDGVCGFWSVHFSFSFIFIMANGWASTLANLFLLVSPRSILWLFFTFGF